MERKRAKNRYVELRNRGGKSEKNVTISKFRPFILATAVVYKST
jgi:hypothetical protein